MAEIKTKVTHQSVTAYLKAIEDADKRADGQKLRKIFIEETGCKPQLWGNTSTTFVGFGCYHYKSERSTQEGEWPLTGFSARKQNLTIYIMPGFNDYRAILEGLGKFKLSKGSCLYIKHLSDIDEKLLRKLIKQSTNDMRKKHGVK